MKRRVGRWAARVATTAAWWAALATEATAVRAQVPADTVRMDPVVVTATRNPTPRSALASAVTVLRGDELEATGTVRLTDALRQVVGVDVVQTGSFGGGTSLFVRGGESDFVKVLVDGVPVNEPGGAIDLADLTTDNVDRVEIVRGPTSVVYGSDAATGVVQIFTRRGSGGARAQIAVGGGSYGSRYAHATVSGGAGPVGYAFGASQRRTDGILPVNNRYASSAWSGLVRATPDARTHATLSTRVVAGEFHFPTDGAGRIVDSNAVQRTDRVAVVLEASRFLSATVEGRLLLGLHDGMGAIDDRPDGVADTVGVFALASERAWARRSVEARANVFVAPGTIVTVGVQLEAQDLRSANTVRSEFGVDSTRTDADRTTRGGYAQLQARVARRVDVTAGVRVDDNSTYGRFLSVRGGVVSPVGHGVRLRAGFGTAFKEPTLFEAFARTPFARGNPALEPERVIGWELGAEHVSAEGRVRLAATYFDQRFRDLVQFTFLTSEPADPNYFNVAAADARGVELEAELRPIPTLTFRGSYTYLRTRVVDAGFDEGPGAGFVVGARLLRRPTHSLGARALLRWSGGAWSLAVRYLGERDDRDFSAYPAVPVVLPAVVLVDGSFEWTLWRGGKSSPSVVATSRVGNLFDVAHQEVAGFPAPGRTVLVGGKLEF